MAPLIAVANLEAACCPSEEWFKFFGELISLVPGKPGSYLQVAYYRFTLESCTTEMLMLFGSKIHHRTARIGRDVHIGSWASLGTVTIGDHVLISPRVSVLSGNKQHNTSDPHKPITADEPHYERVHVGENTFLGEGAILLADVGTRCVVAAGSVVFKAIPDGKVAMGNPARVMFDNPGSVEEVAGPTAAHASPDTP